MAHELWLIKGQKMYNITPLVGTIGRRSNIDELGEELSFDIAYDKTKFQPKNPCELGDMVVLKNGNTEITRTIIVEENRSGNSVSYSAFDYAFYLNKSSAIYQFKKMAADKCIRKILKDFNVPVGNIVSIPTAIDKIFNDVTVSDIIREILEIAEKKRGTKYRMEMRAGKMYIERQSDLKVKARFRLFENGDLYDATAAISNPTRKRSISDMVNAIQIVGNNDKLVLSRQDASMIKKYGRLQKVVQLDQEEKKSAAQIAQNELKKLSKVAEEISIELPGDDSVRAGRLLEVTEPVTGIKGTYLINDVSHTIGSGIHTMSLGLEAR